MCVGVLVFLFEGCIKGAAACCGSPRKRERKASLTALLWVKMCNLSHYCNGIIVFEQSVFLKVSYYCPVLLQRRMWS